LDSEASREGNKAGEEEDRLYALPPGRQRAGMKPENAVMKFEFHLEWKKDMMGTADQ
jgi:hypothetical protein